MDMPRWKMTLIMLAMAAMLLLAAFTMGHRQAPAQVGPITPLPTIAPTQAIIVPTPPAGGPVTFYGNGNSYTYNIEVHETTVDNCAALVGCWR